MRTRAVFYMQPHIVAFSYFASYKIILPVVSAHINFVSVSLKFKRCRRRFLFSCFFTRNVFFYIFAGNKLTADFGKILLAFRYIYTSRDGGEILYFVKIFPQLLRHFFLCCFCLSVFCVIHCRIFLRTFCAVQRNFNKRHAFFVIVWQQSAFFSARKRI